MDKLKEICLNYLPQFRFDHIGVGVVDFKNSKIKTASFIKNDNTVLEANQKVFYDVASITKPLTLALVFQTNPELFDEKMKLLLEHRAGIPEWGLLPKTGWKEIINQYKIKSSKTAYSDFSALRLQLELEKKSGKSLKELVSPHWDTEVLNWKDLKNEYTPATGFRLGKVIKGRVHDPNAYTINEFCSHAGAFATIEGLCQTFLKLNKSTDFISRVEKEAVKRPDDRFIWGFDTVSKEGNSLAGNGFSKHTFGHLGFTGTSIWIDPEKMVGCFVLSNATKWFWYDKELLNDFRRSVGSYVWENY